MILNLYKNILGRLSANKTLSNTFVVALLLVNAVIFGTIIFYNKAQLSTIKKHELFEIEHTLANINEELKHTVNELLTLSESAFLTNFWSINNKAGIRDMLERDYLSVIVNNNLYAQLRIIDSTGMEVIRVNYENCNPVIVPENALQDKSERYYFTDAFVMEKGNIYMSPLDLNVENNEIEKPHKPMIRIATPVFNTCGEKCGIIIINYLASHLLAQLKLGGQPNGKTLLVNSKGYFLKGFKPAEEWLFMFPEKEQVLIEKYIGNFADSIQQNTLMQFETELGLFTCKSVNFEESYFSHDNRNKIQNQHEHYIFNAEKKWTIIKYLSNEYMGKESKVRLLYTFFIMLLLNGIAYLVLLKMNSINKQKQQAFKDLQRSRDELIQINKSRDKLYSILAHDLKSPFNSMMGFSEVLLRKYHKYNDDKRYELIGIISSGINTTYQLLDNLLLWIKSQNGITSYKPINIDLHSLLAGVINECDVIANGKNIAIESQIDGDINVFSDKFLLTTIIRNLLTNAIKFSYNNSKILIKAGLHESNCIVSVSDFGVGMPTHIKDAILNTKAEKVISLEGTQKEKGTGLGLKICKEFVKVNKGDIWVESEVGKGSTFSFSLPIASVI